ncbi:metalloprotease, partial [Burkholderia multivorans]
RRASEARSNALSVRMELQADCFAGVWANNAQRANQRLIEPGDFEQGLKTAAAIGDDRLQQQGQGYVVPESFTHGTSEQRMYWLRRGMESGEL